MFICPGCKKPIIKHVSLQLDPVGHLSVICPECKYVAKVLLTISNLQDQVSEHIEVECQIAD